MDLSQFQFEELPFIQPSPLYKADQARVPNILDHPKSFRSITVDRCSNFTSGEANGSDINLLSQLYKARTNSEEYISLMVYSVPDLKRIPFIEAIQQEFRPTRLGEWFGPSWSTHWFLIQICIPEEFIGEEVQLIWNSDNEALIWSMDGMALQGLTGGAGSDARHDYVITTRADGGEVVQFYIEMACNGMFGAGSHGLIGPPDPNRFFNLTEVDLAVPNKLAWELLHDFQVIVGMAKDLPEDSLRGAQALHAANQIINVFTPGSDASIREGLKIAQQFLTAKNGDGQHEIYAIGHCHIDTAWLWPFDETIRKAARSWSSQINLMDRYPEYKFICSQAQQYEWIKERYLPLWERINEKIANGQFMPTGGAWVEMDTNMPSGESLCRQFLLGQRFFEKNFGQRCNVSWLPDSFGYSSQLPQLMQLAGLDYFFTQKLSWNNVNKFPLTTFWWIGLDGTKTLTHMAPSETYNAQCTPEELVRSVKNHRDRVYSNTSMLVYGNGDGGGGPLSSMIERLQRMKNVDGLPKTHMASPEAFFKNVEKTVTALPSWKGELYFELHRGIYTTHSLCKKLNRSCEAILHDVELLATLCMIQFPDTFHYPSSELEEFWKLLCLTQFHDVMSGSSIEMVYDDCLQMFTKIDSLGKQMRNTMFTRLLGDEITGVEGLAVLNTMSWNRTEVIEIPLQDGLPTLKQYSAFRKSGYAIAQNAFANSITGYDLNADMSYVPVRVESNATNMMMENQYIKVTFDINGHLIELYDKEVERDLIKPNERGNVFKMYDDIPLFWDAWDVEIYHLEKFRIVEEGSIKIMEEGPLLCSLLIEKKLSDTSGLRQIVVLSAVSRRLDFETEVDWNENRQFLKVEFAWDILTDHVNYECQYGHVARPTHFNTSWEAAKFEVVAQKFADMSEFGYGVALLNDSKYGYSAHRNVLRLSLLRSPKAPDSNCDIGQHAFKYAIYPHPNQFLQSDVVQEGCSFNSPLMSKLISQEKVNSVQFSMPKFYMKGAPNVILDTIKKAEDSNDIVLRLYESKGGHARAKLMSSRIISKIVKCNILEDEREVISIIDTAAPLNGRTFSTNLRVLDDDVLEYQQQAQERQLKEGTLIKFKPFEIITLRVSLSPLIT